MKYPRYEEEINALLQKEGEICIRDFIDVFGDMPMPSLYARIRGMVEDGMLSVVGKGRYLAVKKPVFRVSISDWMKSCNTIMVNELEGVSSCITEKNGNLEVEVEKGYMAQAIEVLRKHFGKVMYRKDAKLLAEPPVGYVLVGRLVSDSPLSIEEGVSVSAPEKEIVDAICRKDNDSLAFQRIMEVYPVNRDRLHRYAARRGVAEELSARLQRLDISRVNMFTSVQRYLSRIPVVRAWVFGSFARGEENDSSDLDLLVEYDKSEGLSLLGIIRYQLDMEKLIGRKVDLIEKGYLKPFAQESAEKDKALLPS